MKTERNGKQTGLNDSPTFYDVLELKPDASAQEVREAYLRTKSAYNRDSVALYTLINQEEREEMLRLIEEAYEVLSSPDRRKEYDRYHGLLSLDDDMPVRAPAHRKIVSIDRVPPMESTPEGDDMLVAPSTDFAQGHATPAGGTLRETPPPAPPGHGSAPASPFDSPESPDAPAAAAPPTPTAVTPPPAPPPAYTTSLPPGVPPVAQEIAQEIEWKGLFLRKIREARRMSVEELSGVTKINKAYLSAIEEENFSKLPAAVFLRGFLIQIARVLRLPHDKVATAYMARYYGARPDQRA